MKIILILTVLLVGCQQLCGLKLGRFVARQAALAGTLLALGSAGTLTAPAPAVAASSLLAAQAVNPSSNVKVYWGVGCFWHVQHEFVETERRVLGRRDDAISSLTGYAGGKTTGNGGVVCYHNVLNKGDYGKNGYGEVVGMEIPFAKIGDFAKEYFSLFDRAGDRPDKGDRGPEYRSLLGLPGGVSSPLFSAIKAEADARGIKLVEGKGNDADTMGKDGLVWVMDSNAFPFKQAELYHQFHDGFMPGEQYPERYNSLAALAFKDGRARTTGCPDY